jgi:hypothetical protein
MHIAMLSNGPTAIFDDRWIHSRLLYATIFEVEVSDSQHDKKMRRVHVYDKTHTIQIDSNDICRMESYTDGECKITLRLSEDWGKVS